MAKGYPVCGAVDYIFDHDIDKEEEKQEIDTK